MPILIDPPVSTYSSPEEILAWIRELEKMRAAQGPDPAIASALQEAERWLKVARGRGQGGPAVVTVRDVRLPFASVFRLVAQFTLASMIIGAALFVFWWFVLMLATQSGMESYTPSGRVAPTSSPAVAPTPSSPPGLDPRR